MLSLFYILYFFTEFKVTTQGNKKKKKVNLNWKQKLKRIFLLIIWSSRFVISRFSLYPLRRVTRPMSSRLSSLQLLRCVACDLCTLASNLQMVSVHIHDILLYKWGSYHDAIYICKNLFLSVKSLEEYTLEVLAIDNASYHYRSFKTFLFLNVCYGHCSI